MHVVEIPAFFTPYGGEFCLEQSKALKALGHEVRIVSNVQLSVRISPKKFFCYPYGRSWNVRDGVEVYQSFQRGIPKVVRPNVEHWIGIVQSMFRQYVSRYGKPDVIHAHCVKWAGRAAMLISREYGIPYVITEHLAKMDYETEFGEVTEKTWQIPLLREALEHADMVIPVSEELVDDIAPYFGKDYPWTQLSNTIDTAFYTYRARTPREGRKLRFCVLSIFVPRKAYDVLIPAFDRMHQRYPDTELYIAGRGTEGVECRRMIARMSCADSITICGCLGREQVRDLLWQSDVLVLPSRSEVQPLCVLEAMGTGIPVVASECVPQCERVEGGTFIVPIGDVEALADMMGHVVTMKPADGERLSAYVRDMASPAVVGKRLEAILQSAIARHRS